LDKEEKISILREAQIRRVDHLPIISAFCRKIGLIDTIDQLVPSEMDTSPGVIVQGMVLDTLSGRSPLYRLEEFFKQQDIELLFGREIDAHSFNDTKVGRAMDMMYEVGTMKILSQIAFNAVKIFSCDLKYVHFDTTSVNVWGDYKLYGKDSKIKGIKIVKGHSKDHRPDLKQFMIKTLCVEKNIPILGGCEDGNGSDKKINNGVLTDISKIMARYGLSPGAYIYVADSAMVNEDNLKEVRENLFITRLPFNYNECNDAVARAVQADNWVDLGMLAETMPSTTRPAALYRAQETEVTLYGKNYRAVVIYSSAHDKRRKKRIDRELNESKQILEQALEKENKIGYFCRKDAEAACSRLEKVKSKYYRIETEIVEKVKYARGRPKKNQPRKIVETKYEIVAQFKEKAEEVERKKDEAGCFVLLTNVPQEGDLAHNSEEILRVYKDQHGVERNFAFLKDPLIVNDLFLKKASRIEVLGMILIITLLVWNLIERSLREYIKETGESITGWDNKQTYRPTTFMMTTKFFGVQVIKLEKLRILSGQLTKVQLEYLKAMGLPVSVFIDP